jgi:hypothetical protein
MTRTGSSRHVADDFWRGRLASGRGFHEAARTLLTLAEPAQDSNPTIVQIVSAAIAYADAVTARRVGAVNQQDHRAAGALLRNAVGNRLPSSQLANLTDIVAQKDAASYGARAGTRAQAERLLERLDQFAAWAEDELSR